MGISSFLAQKKYVGQKYVLWQKNSEFLERNFAGLGQIKKFKLAFCYLAGFSKGCDFRLECK